MDWININDKKPDPYQEVIICSDAGRVKSAIYMRDGKWSTFLNVAMWMPMPTPPVMNNDNPIEAPKKKRGRPKKV